ncbi:MAG: WbqC family protein [bacterium]|nr:WbqC family protein [bacterium]MCP5067748.1 WbqC family protein [bacterium]
MRLAIMQPTYLPWSGYLDLADQVDAFVFLDDASFAHRSWQQRNRIVANGALQWLTVPVRVKGLRGQTIQEVEIARPDFWLKHLRTLAHAYARAPFFAQSAPGLEAVFSRQGGWTELAGLNLALIEWLFDEFGIAVPTHRSSQLKAGSRRGERLAAICEELGADHYLSTPGAEPYLMEDQEPFLSRGIRVSIQSFELPLYSQCCESFVSQASAVDLLFNEGPEALSILRRGRHDARPIGAAK